jgi:photosystem II stability/assembly factor-like uncharacterized protein
LRHLSIAPIDVRRIMSVHASMSSRRHDVARSVKILVGTRKAAFIYTSDEKRQKWELSKPIYTGWSVYNMAADTRGDRPRLYAAANHWAWGPSVAKSDDLGETWNYVSKGLAFPADAGQTVQNVWNIAPGHASEPGVVYAGTQPAALFRSEDWGHTWAGVDGLNKHETQPQWSMSGGGDSALHSIEIDPRDPKHMFAAISTGGAFVTQDGGATWRIFARNLIAEDKRSVEWMGEMAKAFPDQPAPEGVDPLAVQEMHKMRMAPADPTRIWTQTHTGVFRSDDSGATWRDVTEGLPSFHGFGLAVGKSPDTAYTVPIAYSGFYDNFRVVDGQFAVWRTRDGGKTWQSSIDGLPGPHDYQSVYREGMDSDGLDGEGVYVGTTNGAVYASTDGGERWQRLPGTLPPILSITAAVIE